MKKQILAIFIILFIIKISIVSALEIVITDETITQRFGYDKDSIMQLSDSHFFAKLSLFNYEEKRAYKIFVIFDCKNKTSEFISEFQYDLKTGKTLNIIYKPLAERKIDPIDEESHLYKTMEKVCNFPKTMKKEKQPKKDK